MLTFYQEIEIVSAFLLMSGVSFLCITSKKGYCLNLMKCLYLTFVKDIESG